MNTNDYRIVELNNGKFAIQMWVFLFWMTEMQPHKGSFFKKPEPIMYDTIDDAVKTMRIRFSVGKQKNPTKVKKFIGEIHFWIDG